MFWLYEKKTKEKKDSILKNAAVLTNLLDICNRLIKMTSSRKKKKPAKNWLNKKDNNRM